MKFALIVGTGFVFPRAGAKHLIPTSPPDMVGALLGKPISRTHLIGDKLGYFHLMERHNFGGTHVPPHAIPYLDNMYALSRMGITHVVSINCVGSINRSLKLGTIVIPGDYIDYTKNRKDSITYLEGFPTVHVDQSYPMSIPLRTKLRSAAARANIKIAGNTGLVYGCTEGPRLETPAEITRMHRDGCDVVGMTAYPEAPLARELGMEYACISVVGNWAAGIASKEINEAEMKRVIAPGLANAVKMFHGVRAHSK